MPKKISYAYIDLESGVLKVKNGKTHAKMKNTAKPKPKKNNTQLSFSSNSLKSNNDHYILKGKVINITSISIKITAFLNFISIHNGINFINWFS